MTELTTAQKTNQVMTAFKEGRLSFVEAVKLLRLCNIPTAMAISWLRRAR